MNSSKIAEDIDVSQERNRIQNDEANYDILVVKNLTKRYRLVLKMNFSKLISNLIIGIWIFKEKPQDQEFARWIMFVFQYHGVIVLVYWA